MKKSFNEEMAQFFENPSRDSLRVLLENHHGEQNYLDFKGSWPEISKIAKHVLAMANSGGGVIVVGVSEKDGVLEANGIEELLDKADVYNKIRSFVPSELEYFIMDFPFNSSEYTLINGKKFQVLFVEYKENYIPYIAKRDGNGIKENAIYIRKGTSSEEVSYEELQKIINLRIGTQYSTSSEIKLEEHLSQLKILFSQIEKSILVNTVGQSTVYSEMTKRLSKFLFSAKETIPNPAYPKEDYDDFIARMILLKKDKIEKLIDK